MNTPSYDLGYQDGIGGMASWSTNTDYIKGYADGLIAYTNRQDINAVSDDVRLYAEGFEDGRFNSAKRFTDTMYLNGYADGNYIFIDNATIEVSTDESGNSTTTTVTTSGTNTTVKDSTGKIISTTKKNISLSFIIGIIIVALVFVKD